MEGRGYPDCTIVPGDNNSEHSAHRPSTAPREAGPWGWPSGSTARQPPRLASARYLPVSLPACDPAQVGPPGLDTQHYHSLPSTPFNGHPLVISPELLKKACLLSPLLNLQTHPKRHKPKVCFVEKADLLSSCQPEDMTTVCSKGQQSVPETHLHLCHK